MPQADAPQPARWDQRPMDPEPEREGIAGPIIIASIGAALLGAVLALVVLAWLNNGELEYQTRGAAVSGEQGQSLAGLGEGKESSEVDALQAEVRRLASQVERLSEAAGVPMVTEEPTAEPTVEAATAEASEEATAEETEEATAEASEEPVTPGATPRPTRQPRPTPTLRIIP